MKQKQAKQNIQIARDRHIQSDDEKLQMTYASAHSSDEVKQKDKFYSLRVTPIAERVEKGQRDIPDGRFANNDEILSIFGMNQIQDE